MSKNNLSRLFAVAAGGLTGGAAATLAKLSMLPVLWPIGPLLGGISVVGGAVAAGSAYYFLCSKKNVNIHKRLFTTSFLAGALTFAFASNSLNERDVRKESVVSSVQYLESFKGEDHKRTMNRDEGRLLYLRI
jgi:hypothetical protein